MSVMSSGVFIGNFEHISHFFQVFLLLTSKKKVSRDRSLKVFIFTDKHKSHTKEIDLKLCLKKIV